MSFKSIIALALAAGSSVACAQGYVGAVVALSNLDLSCQTGRKCDDSGNGWKLFGGTRLEQPLVSLGRAHVNVVEVGLMRFGKASDQFTRRISINNGQGTVEQVNVPAAETVSVNALTFAMGATISLAQRASLVPKVGLAYVSATSRSSVNGISQGSETKSSLQPYLGVSLGYEAVQGVTVNAGVDWTRARTEDRGGASALLMGVGASVAF